MSSSEMSRFEIQKLFAIQIQNYRHPINELFSDFDESSDGYSSTDSNSDTIER